MYLSLFFNNYMKHNISLKKTNKLHKIIPIQFITIKISLNNIKRVELNKF